MDSESNRKETVLVAGPSFHSYVRMVAAAFSNYSKCVIPIEWVDTDYDISKALRSVVSRQERKSTRITREAKKSIDLESTIRRTRPNLALVLNGAQVSDKLSEFCSTNGIRLALWAYDSLSHFPEIAKQAERYDAVYVYEPNDIELLSNHRFARYLPLAYDPEKYHPNPANVGYEYDVSFVGTLAGHPERPRSLRMLASELQSIRIGVWSNRMRWYSPQRVRDLRFSFGLGNLTLRRSSPDHSQINDIYNKSRICINIHHAQNKNGVNPRTFEILGSGGFLLTDRNLDSLGDFERNTDYVLYESTQDLIEVVRDYVEHESRRVCISKSGHGKVVKAHTYAHRAKTILEHMSSW